MADPTNENAVATFFALLARLRTGATSFPMVVAAVLTGPLLIAVVARILGLGEMGLELARLVYAWPAALSLILTFFLVRHARDISALMGRIASIKVRGVEVTTTQRAKLDEETTNKVPEVRDLPVLPVQEGVTLSKEEMTALQQALSSERATAYLWEYRYLNYYLVPRTQLLLDWLVAMKGKPPTLHLLDSLLSPLVPESVERGAMYRALTQHWLVEEQQGLMCVTPKGQEYVTWRGPMPANAVPATVSSIMSAYPEAADQV